MIRFYAPYTDWEDYINGMYSDSAQDFDVMVTNGTLLLSNQLLFLSTMERVLSEWNIATKVNLTNRFQNRRAWLGQAACCFKYQIPEKVTRVIWQQLPTEDKIKANKSADSVISHYEENNKYLHKGLGIQRLF